MLRRHRGQLGFAGGTKSFTHGTNPSYYITSATDSKVADVLAHVVSIGAVTRYTFTAIDAPHTISASFALK